jgi:hypothetical protein
MNKIYNIFLLVDPNFQVWELQDIYHKWFLLIKLGYEIGELQFHCQFHELQPINIARDNTLLSSFP